MRTRKRQIVMATAALICIYIAVLFSLRAHSVLWRLDGAVSFEQEHAFDILNPFRDRAPEKAAEAALFEISEGNCNAVAQRVYQKVDPACARDTQLHIVSWKLQARNDKPDGSVILLYEVKRDFGTDGVQKDPYWFAVKKNADHRWALTEMERWF